MDIKQYNASCVRLLLQIALDDNELAIRQVCQEVGLAYHRLEKPTQHIEPALQEKLWIRLAAQVDTTDLGLRLGQQLGATWGGFVSLISQVSPTLHVALHQFGQYKELFTDPVYYQTFDAIDQGELTYFEITFLEVNAVCYPFYSRHTAEGMFVAAQQLLQDLSKRPISPIRIDWQHPRPSSLDLHQRVFQVPMQFNTGVNRLYFRRRDLNRRVVTHNPVLYSHFTESITAFQLQGQRRSLAEQVRVLTVQCLTNHQPIVIEQIADALNVSVRTLQRKLEQEQAVFQLIVDEVRKEIALQLVGSKKYNITEVASLIGYDESSSFRRAFKRWTGSTPTSFLKSAV